MKIIHAANELKPGSRKVCLAIGFFDGVHLGHQQIIRQTIADARQHDAIALVLTFDRHPNAVVAPDRVPPLIYSLPQKLRAIESLGADTLLLIHFDEDIQPANRRGFHPPAGARSGTNSKPVRRRGFCLRPQAQRQRRAAEKTRRRNRVYRPRTRRRFARRPNRQQHAHSRGDPRRRPGRREPDARTALRDFRPGRGRRPRGPATGFSHRES